MCDVYSGISETNIIKAKEAVAAAVGKGNSSTRLSCGRKKKIYTLLQCRTLKASSKYDCTRRQKQQKADADKKK